jgi:vacuolar-type H+-ATPase subunit I/STV1
VSFADRQHDLPDTPHYLTIVYAAPDRKEEPDKKDKEKPEELTLEQEREKQRKERDKEEEKAREKKPDAVAVFELGDGILKETLRILESRSGKRIRYQDAEARRSAR